MPKANTLASAALAITPAEIQLAAMLIGLGIKTAEQIREYFGHKVSDDAALDGIMAECDRRIARRA